MAWRSLLPAALLLQRFHDLARHIALVVLGEDRFGAQAPRRLQHPLGDDALSLAEQVGHGNSPA